MNEDDMIIGSINIGNDLILFQGNTIEEAIEDLLKMYNFHFDLDMEEKDV